MTTYPTLLGALLALTCSGNPPESPTATTKARPKGVAVAKAGKEATPTPAPATPPTAPAKPSVPKREVRRPLPAHLFM